jgi:hypothetical protein
LIVDAFVAHDPLVVLFIPPFVEIRGGVGVVIDASINPNDVKMYAAVGNTRGRQYEKPNQDSTDDYVPIGPHVGRSPPPIMSLVIEISYRIPSPAKSSQTIMFCSFL